MVLENIHEQLLQGEMTVSVWGTGYIGYSTMANFAFSGVKCVGTDVVQEKVDMINKGVSPIENFEKWLGFDVKPIADSGLLKATTNWKSLLKPEIGVHMIAIPTEKDGKPYDVILEDVIRKISTIKPGKEPVIIIIESTLTPGRTDKVVIPILEKAGLKVGKDVLVGVAPRRDWFISPEKSLKNLPRIIGGTTQETTRIMKDVLSVICDHLLPAPDHKHAEMIKSIENAYRHAEITLANQLSLAYPEIDMEVVLKLVGTKWNIGCYSPDTSILTERGFEKVDNISEGDRIWSVNPESKVLELATAEKLYFGYFDGEMIRARKRRYGVDFLITPNHNLPIQVYNNPKNVKFIKAEEALSYRKIRLINKIIWTGIDSNIIPQSFREIIKTEKRQKKWLSLLGWFISEGSLWHKSGNYEVTVYQEKGKYHDEIFRLFKVLGFNPNQRIERGKGRIRVSNKDLFTYLKENVGHISYTKRIPKEALSLPPLQLKYIFESLMKGDGHKQNNQYKYTTVSKQLKDDVCELALKLGYHVKIRKQKHVFKIIITSVQNHELSPLKRTFKGGSFGPQLFKEKYKGNVYCPALDKNHTLIIERNGCVSINGNTYHPSFGTGGYCIPLSSQYVLLGAKNPEQLTILKSAIETDSRQPSVVAESIVKRGCKRVGILGLAYKGDIKVDILSPAIKIAQRLREKGVSVKIHDPLYMEQEIKKISGCETFRFPQDLQEFDAVLLVADHQLYRFTPNTVILNNLKKCKVVLDNTGIWQDIDFRKINVEYHVAGDKRWLE